MKEGLHYNQLEIEHSDKETYEELKVKVPALFDALDEVTPHWMEKIDIIASTFKITPKEVKSYLTLTESKQTKMKTENTFYFQSKEDVAEIKGFEHPVAQSLAVAILANLRPSIAETLEEQGIEDNFIITFELKAPRLEAEEGNEEVEEDEDDNDDEKEETKEKATKGDEDEDEAED